MGMMSDRWEGKRSKYRFYILVTPPIPVAILTFLLFYAPNIGQTEKMKVYAGITYVLWGMIYTVSDVPFWSLPNAMTPNPKERARLISMGRTINGVDAAIPLAIVMFLGFVLPLMGLSGNQLERTRYMTAAIVASVVGNAVFMVAYFYSKERVKIPRPVRKPGDPSVLKLLFKCKPLMLVVIMGVLSSTGIFAGGRNTCRKVFFLYQAKPFGP